MSELLDDFPVLSYPPLIFPATSILSGGNSHEIPYRISIFSFSQHFPSIFQASDSDGQAKHGVKHTVIADNAGGHLMRCAKTGDSQIGRRRYFEETRFLVGGFNWLVVYIHITIDIL